MTEFLEALGALIAVIFVLEASFLLIAKAAEKFLD